MNGSRSQFEVSSFRSTSVAHDRRIGPRAGPINALPPQTVERSTVCAYLWEGRPRPDYSTQQTKDITIATSAIAPRRASHKTTPPPYPHLHGDIESPTKAAPCLRVEVALASPVGGAPRPDYPLRHSNDITIASSAIAPRRASHKTTPPPYPDLHGDIESPTKAAPRLPVEVALASPVGGAPRPDCPPRHIDGIATSNSVIAPGAGLPQ
jgi:hypothetical protein